MSREAQYMSLKGPCSNCPFRNDSAAIGLPTVRREEIADSLENDGSFVCHKTVQRDENDERIVGIDHERFCGGAAATMVKNQEQNLPVRLALYFGMADIDSYEVDHVFTGLDEWIAKGKSY